MIELGEKYVFHIPMYRYADDELIPIELDNLLDDLVLKLGDDGFDSMYVTKAKSFFTLQKQLNVSPQSGNFSLMQIAVSQAVHIKNVQLMGKLP